MKILNLYAGIGGNRKLWGDEHEITAVEMNPEIADIYKDFYPNDKIVVGDAHQYLLEQYKNFDFIWASPPCQTHSRARLWGFRDSDKVEKKYPDMKLYQEIIFLKHYYDGYWCVENVIPFYEPLIPPNCKLGRHYFWSNFKISQINPIDADINRGISQSYKNIHGVDLTGKKITQRKDQIYRNCVHYETGLHILNCAQGIFNSNKQQQLELNL